jgi:hypothetical protein
MKNGRIIKKYPTPKTSPITEKINSLPRFTKKI